MHSHLVPIQCRAGSQSLQLLIPEPVIRNATDLKALPFRICRWPRVQLFCGSISVSIMTPVGGIKSRPSNVSSLVSEPRRLTEMFNNSTGQPQPQITSAGHDSSNRSSRTSNETPSSRSAREVGLTLLFRKCALILPSDYSLRRHFMRV